MLQPVIAARPRSAAARLFVVLACAALPLTLGCGKKGPPLAPLSTLPVAPPQVSASRADEVVTIRFTVPTANVSGVHPADIERVDVYAWTGPDVAAPRVFKLAKVVASVPVRPPPPPQEADDEGHVPPPPPPGPGVDQGAPTELHETLPADAREPIDVSDPKKKPALVREPKVTPPDTMPLPPPLTRRYLVVGVNHGGKRGPAAPAVAVPLWPPPPPPTGVIATAQATGTKVTWNAPQHLRQPVMAHALPPVARAAAPSPSAARPNASAARPSTGVQEAPPATGERSEDLDDDEDRDQPPPDQNQLPADQNEPPPVQDERPAERGEAPAPAPVNPEPPADLPTGSRTGLLPAGLVMPWPSVTIGYHVYDVASAGAPGAPPSPAGSQTPAPPLRLTTAPLTTTTFSDTRVEYGVERCYLVRTVEMVGTLGVESAWSVPACIKPADVFPPAVPKSLAAVASEGAISLIWEGSEEPDLAGYVVLRGIVPGPPAERLTPAPIRETTFRDTTVKPGTRYVYAVIAIDTAKPPNASAPSNQVQETAR